MGGRRKTVVVLFGGIISRVALLAWVVLPLLAHDPSTAIAVIIAVNPVITFANNFANPAWTAIVADIVPREIRGRFFSHRNFAVNLPALLIVPLAGLLIQLGTGQVPRSPVTSSFSFLPLLPASSPCWLSPGTTILYRPARLVSRCSSANWFGRFTVRRLPEPGRVYVDLEPGVQMSPLPERLSRQ